jgi:pseudoazurin
MRNLHDGQSMVFYPSFLKISINDEVEFIPKDPGHTSRSVLLPKEETKNWQGVTSQKVSYKFSKEGLYIYECANHGIMGMVGIIQVGNPINLEDAKKFAEEFKKKLILNKTRLNQLLDTIKP